MITVTMLLLSLLNDSLLDRMFREYSGKSEVRKVVGERCSPVRQAESSGDS